MLKENLANVEKNIEQACKNAGRSRDEVTLIAVSKTKPVEMLQEIYDENIRDFGENKVQCHDIRHSLTTITAIEN